MPDTSKCYFVRQMQRRLSSTDDTQDENDCLLAADTVCVHENGQVSTEDWDASGSTAMQANQLHIFSHCFSDKSAVQSTGYLVDVLRYEDSFCVQEGHLHIQETSCQMRRLRQGASHHFMKAGVSIYCTCINHAMTKGRLMSVQTACTITTLGIDVMATCNCKACREGLHLQHMCKKAERKMKCFDEYYPSGPCTSNAALPCRFQCMLAAEDNLD